MPTSSFHIIDYLWGRRSSLDSLRNGRLNSILLTHLLIWSILCAVLEWYFCNRIPCKLYVGPSVILCLIDIEHLYWLIQCENVVLILSWYSRIGITGVNFCMPKCYLTPVTHHWFVNIGNTATLIEILRCSAIWSMEFPWWLHQKPVNPPPTKRASNVGLFFALV